MSICVLNTVTKTASRESNLISFSFGLLHSESLFAASFTNKTALRPKYTFQQKNASTVT